METLSKAMVIHPTIKLKKLPRMADFAYWGYAIAEALGIGGKKFLEAYKVNINEQNQEVLEGIPVATAVMEFMKERNEWRGSSSELLERLEEVVNDLRLNMSAKNWPKAPNTLSRKLNEIHPNLKQVGVSIKPLKDEMGIKGRGIQIKKTTVDIVETVDSSMANHQPGDDKDSKDDTLGGMNVEQEAIGKMTKDAEEVFTEKEDSDFKNSNNTK